MGDEKNEMNRKKINHEVTEIAGNSPCDTSNGKTVTLRQKLIKFRDTVRNEQKV